MKGKHILIVDDDGDFVASLEACFKAKGYRVSTAAEGASAIDVAKQARPDVILLDVMMTTDTEGIEVSRKIAETPELRGTPVILLTGIRTARSLPFAPSPDENWLPVKSVLEKPIPLDRILDAIRRLIG